MKFRPRLLERRTENWIGGTLSFPPDTQALKSTAVSRGAVVTIWRPSCAIAAKVLGLAWRGEQILVFDVENDDGTIKGVRPLGGSIEFGETRERALLREFKEELGCEISICGPWHSLENIYEHEGGMGHELVFIANVKIVDESVYAQEVISFVEANLLPCRARWLPPLTLSDGMELYPNGLRQLIETGAILPAT